VKRTEDLRLKDILPAYFRVVDYWKKKGTNDVYVLVRTPIDPETTPDAQLEPIVKTLCDLVDMKFKEVTRVGNRIYRIVIESKDPVFVVGLFKTWEEAAKETLKK